MVFKALELSHRPGYEHLIDVPQQGIQRRWGVSPVVLDPTPQEWIELQGNGPGNREIQRLLGFQGSNFNVF